MFDITKFHTEADWIDAAINEVWDVIDDVEDAVIGLAGGSTPMPVYEKLGKMDLAGVTFIVIDERYVPLDDEHSNYRVIREAMPNAKIIYFDTSLSVDRCLVDMDEKIAWLEIDLLILGMGLDGHVASLFPDTPTDSHDLVIETETDNFDVKKRVTLNYSALEDAHEAMLLIKGEEKLAVLENLDHSLPIAHVLDSVDTHVYVL